MAFRMAERIRDLPNYPFVEINKAVQKKQAEGQPVFRLDMGSPDMAPPVAVIDKLSEIAHRSDKHGYTEYRGIPEFRKAVARFYQRLYDIQLDPDTEILPLIGSKEGIMNMTLATVGAGDIVLIPSPAYPAYEMTARIAQAECYILPLKAENGFLPDLSAIPAEIAQRARMLWANYPNNPTGALASLDDYARMLEYCREHDILLASDNPYAAVVFDGPIAPSALQVSGAKEWAVEFMSLSKSHNMAGWRLGACVGNSDAIAALLRVKSNTDSGHFAPVYEAGIFALDETPLEWIEERNKIYARRAQAVIDVVDELGLRLDTPPKGSLYVWAAVVGGDDVAYTRDALQEAGVSMVPGSMYGETGRGYIRISLTLPEERITEAMNRLREWNKSKA